MSDTNTLNSRVAPAKAVWWRDAKVRGIIAQVLLIVAVFATGYFLINNMFENLAAKGQSIGFDFLWKQSAGFEVDISPFIAFEPESSYLTVIAVATLNTLMVAICGIILATIIGFLMGVARLSKNWVVAKVAGWYVEIFRNIPLLIQIIFCYSAYLIAFEGVGLSDIALFESFYINGRGIYTPYPEWLRSGALGYGFLFVLVLAIIGIVWMKRWAKERQNRTGQQFPTFIASLGIFFGLPLLYLVVLSLFGDWPVGFDIPELKSRFNLGGGAHISPEFLGLLIALSLYTSAFIAESVRSGIQAVSKGQKEAAAALGLRPSRSMRLVVIPQALRVIIPQLTNQYLNLTKNSSLGTAIAYPEIVNLVMGTSISNTARTVELVLIVMSIYLTISLLTSLFMNWYNNKMSLVER